MNDLAEVFLAKIWTDFYTFLGVKFFRFFDQSTRVCSISLDYYNTLSWHALWSTFIGYLFEGKPKKQSFLSEINILGNYARI